jgi:hypothetical protein
MGVGSEVYSAVRMDRRGIGIELKRSYYMQAVKNVRRAATDEDKEQKTLFEAAPIRDLIEAAIE